MVNNGHDSGLERQLEFLREKYLNDPSILVCNVCYFPIDWHLYNTKDVNFHKPTYWPIEHVIRQIELELSYA